MRKGGGGREKGSCASVLTRLCARLCARPPARARAALASAMKLSQPFSVQKVPGASSVTQGPYWCGGLSAAVLAAAAMSSALPSAPVQQVSSVAQTSWLPDAHFCALALLMPPLPCAAALRHTTKGTNFAG